MLGGVVFILLGALYPYISYKNQESEINSNIHFFITHLRVLAISDLSLKDIINVLGDKPVYKSLGKEAKKIGVLSTQWRYPMASTMHFVALRTPSKILKDFLDRFSQSLDSGVSHREFIETEQNAVLQEYKTMYETSNENIVILNEVYVSMLIAIIFVESSTGYAIFWTVARGLKIIAKITITRVICGQAQNIEPFVTKWSDVQSSYLAAGRLWLHSL